MNPSGKSFRSALEATRRSHEKRSYEVGWGRIWPADDELSALRIAYLFRNAPKGVKVEQVPSGEYHVTVFANDCADGIDRW